MNFLNGLNPEQRACVETLRGPLLLLAGAGTGKTRVITVRIANLVAHGVPPDRIVALTFTNKAAREMAERVNQICPRAKNKLWVGTFHSFCLNLLRKHHRHIDLPARFSIAGTSDQLELIRKGLEEKSWSGVFRPESMLYAISYAKNQLCSPEEVAEGKGLPDSCEYDPLAIATVYELYERQLKLHQCIDFDDCIYKVVHLLNDNLELKKTIASSFDHFLVDEFQDTNLSQLKVVELLCNDHRNICVVGDDDQSIYSWRGADSQVLLKFESVFPEAKLIKLEQNYRCTNVILNAANHVIKNNTQRKDKVLWSASKATNEILLSVRDDEIDEARWIASRCLSFMGRDYNPKDIAILYRANAQGRALEVALREANINYRVFGGQSLFERREIKDVLAYLKLVANQNERLGFWRILNTPQRGLGLKSAEKIAQLANDFRSSPFKILTHPDTPVRIQEAGAPLVEAVQKLASTPLNTPEDVSALIKNIIWTFRFESHLRETSSSPQIADRRIDIIRRMPDWIGELARKLFPDGERINLNDICDALALNDVEKKEDDQANYVSLMTVHSAKGLEFPIVFVCGLEEGILPHRNSLDFTDSINEERRLFYVAITRAKEHLILSHAVERGTGHRKNDGKPSRFLKELPEQGIIKADHIEEKVSESEKRKRTLNRISNLRASLKS